MTMMKSLKAFAFASATGLMMFANSEANAAIVATADMTAQSLGGGVYQYNIILHNTGDTTIGTLWYAWDDSGLNFLTTHPTNITSPTGWSAFTTGGGPYGIEWTGSSALLAAGGSLSGFSFRSTDTPAFVAGTSFDPSFPVGTTFAYINGAFGDAGYQFTVAPVPEPTSLAFFVVGGLGLLARRRVA